MKTRNMTWKSIGSRVLGGALANLLLLGILGFPLDNAQAAVIVADFNGPGYTTGDLDTQDPADDGLGAWSVTGGGQDVGAGDITPSSPPVKYLGQSGTGQSLTAYIGGTSNLFEAALDTAMVSSEFWFSFVFDTGIQGNSRRGIRLSGSGASELRIIEVQPDLRIMTGDTTLATAASVVASNTSYLIVGQLIADTSGSNDTVNLWLAPDDVRNLDTPTLTWAGDNFVVAGNGLNTLGAEAYYSNGGGLDYLVLASSQDEWVNQLIPEPSTLALLLLAAAGALNRRRRTG